MAQDFDRVRARGILARSVLRMRTDAQRSLAEAEAAGDRKQIQSWQSELRKIEKLIAQYGLEQHA
jgi:hypothetical protein